MSHALVYSLANAHTCMMYKEICILCNSQKGVKALIPSVGTCNWRVLQRGWGHIQTWKTLLYVAGNCVNALLLVAKWYLCVCTDNYELKSRVYAEKDIRTTRHSCSSTSPASLNKSCKFYINLAEEFKWNEVIKQGGDIQWLHPCPPQPPHLHLNETTFMFLHF